MFSQCGIKIVASKNINRIINISRRNLCWMKNQNGIYTLGITKKTINNYFNVNSIHFNENKFVKSNSELFVIETNNFIEGVDAPFDCKVIKKNNEAINYINIDPENIEISWIIKIKPIVWNKNINKSFYNYFEDYFSNYDNTQRIPIFNVNHN